MLKCTLAVAMFILLLAATTLSAQEADQRAGKAAPELTLSSFKPSGTDDFETVRLPSEKYLKTVQVTLRGTNFNLKQPEQNQILIDDKPQEVKWWQPGDSEALPNAAEPNKNQIYGKVVSPEMIELYRVPVSADGVIKVAVQQGEKRTPDRRFIVYRSWSKVVVGTISAAIAIVLALAVLGLIKLFINSQSKSFAFSPLQVLFLDPETNTYSLSKLQFYCWTVAGLFGYSYLAISKIWVQGLSWPDMPGGLPSIIAIGAGTSVGSQMITNLRGPKGAGNEMPSLGDFVTSGGVAAADRVQMLVWTILGVGIFGLSVLTHQPDSIPGLDPVPDGMLSIMGLSAMGYLGGKFARKPGPVINEISITPAAGDDRVIGTTDAASTGQNQDAVSPGPEAKRFVRYIELRGRNLSSEALLEIDGVQLPFRMLRNKEGKKAPDLITGDEKDNPTFARELKLSIDPWQLEEPDLQQYKQWFGTSDDKKNKMFTLINPDGQKAVISFTVPPAASQSKVQTGQEVTDEGK